MVRLRAHYDGDRANIFNPTLFQTDQNRNKVYCGMCGDIFFVDDALFDEIIKVIKETTESPFLCKTCRQEYDELAYR